MVRLKSFQQRRQRDSVEEGVNEVKVDEGICVQSVHCKLVHISTIHLQYCVFCKKNHM